MNIAKNMEVIFFAAIALISATSFATASADVPAGRGASVITSASTGASAAAAQANMQVVTVSAKRMSAAEKAAAAQ